MTSSHPLALITGGHRRVGAAIAREFARAGFDLTLTCNRAESQAEAVALSAALMREHPITVVVERIDLGDPDGVELFGARLRRGLGRLDVLIHNASVYAPTPLTELTSHDALLQYRVNALAPLLLSQHLAPRLAESTLPGGGAIVALADMHALGRPRRGMAAYLMSKAALVEMVRDLARDLAPHVRVNAVAPGVVAFPASGPESEPATQSAYLSRVPLERSGKPEDAARAVRFLAIEAVYTTGEILRVDGGRWLA
ncbi:MAG: SDR family oxidoreductase [Phycisphaerae bacterium]|nr:SDR family oxidoreductase [Phycisphaerae bacterium]